MCRLLIAVLLLMSLLPTARGDEPAEQPAATAPVYARDVHRFFKTYCIGCHSDDEPESGLSLQSFAGLNRGGDSGEPIVVPGKPTESLLVKVLSPKGEPKMPPEDSKQPKPEEVALIVRWIESGAKGPDSGEAKPSVGYETPDVPKILPKGPVTPAVVSVAYAPDGKLLAAARHREVLLLQTSDGKKTITLQGATAPLNAVAFSPDGKLVAAAGGPAGIGGSMHLWQPDGKSLAVLHGHDDAIYGLAFSPDGKLLATSSYDKLIKIWDVASGQELRTLKHHTAAVFGIAFSPNGETLASAGDDQTVKLWDVATGNRIVTLGEPTKGVTAVAFHPTGKELAAVGADKTLRVWNWDGKRSRIRNSLFAHDAAILAIAYSPDGTTLFTASEDRRIKAWDNSTLRERHVYEGLTDWPQALAISPGGKQLTAGLSDGNLLTFDATQASEAAVLIAGLRPKPVVEEKATAEKIPPRTREPELSGISPRAIVRGTTVQLTLSGRNISTADQLFISPGHLKAKLLPADSKKPNVTRCEVELPADLSPRMVTLRLHTPEGSTGAKSFYVGPFAEISENKANNNLAGATPATLPATLVGTIGEKGEFDVWSFDADAGAEVVFQCIGSALGSALNARLTILDADGQKIVHSERHPSRRDVVIGHRFEKAGKYYLQVEDLRFTGGGGHYYYIHAGRFAYVESTFPLGIQSGTDGTVTALGYNLGEAAKIVPKKESTGTRSERLATEVGPTLNEARYELSPFAEIAEAEPNDSPKQAVPILVPGAVSGHISGTKNQVDHIAFEAKKGERLLIEVFARRLGSPLDSVIDILTAEGKPVGRQTLRAVAKTYVALRDHSSRREGIRMQNWDSFQINDYLMLGGEVVKIRALPLGPDADVKLFAEGGRLGYFGTTPQGHARDSDIFKVEVHPPGMSFPPNGMPVVALNYRNDDGGPRMGSDSRLFFDAPADGRYVIRLNDVRGLAGDDFYYRLVVRQPQPDFRISMSPADPNVPRGGHLPVTITASRLEGFSGPIDVRMDGLPEGITATSGRIGTDDLTCVITLSASDDATTGPTPLTTKAIGTAVVGEQTIEHSTNTGFGLHQVSIGPPATLDVTVTPAEATIRPGEEIRFELKLQRNYGFDGRVPIKIDNLPHGVRVLHVGLNGVLIPEERTTQSFVIRCDPWAERRAVTFFATARVEATGELNSSAPLVLNVTGETDAVASGN